MALAYAVQQLTAAVRLLAIGSAFPDQRLQQVWADQVANLRTSVYLPEHPNEQFKQMWARYAATVGRSPQHCVA
jgi:AMMECR1 domain-containing protein